MADGGVRRSAGPLRLWRALGADLDAALASGAARDAWPDATAAAWLSHAALSALALGAGLWLLVGYHAGFASLNAAAASLPSWLWQGLTVLGDERVAFALSLLLARRHPRVFWALVVAAVVGALYSRGLKPLFDAARPPAVLAPDSFNLIGPAHRSESFPSGHSVTAAVFFGVLALFARRRTWRVVFLLAAVAVGVSRTAVGVHWPVDVAFGLGGGWLAVVIGARLARRSPWGIRDGSVHLAFVSVAAIVSIGLWLDDGGYPAVGPALQALSAAALGATLLGYAVIPLARCVRRLTRE
ncbi:MAG: phosphatase PAP2 family protein [Thiohalocapsa sp.]|jgi:membrane-associated phospholipid phosphatase